MQVNRLSPTMKLPLIFVLVFLIYFILNLVNPTTTLFKAESADKQINVYCASALRGPVKEAITDFEAAHQVEVEIIYGSSGELLAQIESSGGAGVYIPGDPQFIDQLSAEKIVREKTLAYHFPVIVGRNDPDLKLKNIQTLQSGQANSRDDLKFVLVEPALSALGDSSKRLLKNINLTNQAEKNLKGLVSTASQVPLYLSMGVGDVGITWHSNFLMYEEDLQKIEYPDAYQEEIPVRGVVFDSDRRRAEKTGKDVDTDAGDEENGRKKHARLLDYLSSAKAESIFQHHGYLTEMDGE